LLDPDRQAQNTSPNPEKFIPPDSSGFGSFPLWFILWERWKCEKIERRILKNLFAE
jgi:hypothetical protein